MERSYTSMNEGSNPINIPNKLPTYVLSEYNIKQNFFNPNKHSPPTFFTKKIETRLQTYYNKLPHVN